MIRDDMMIEDNRWRQWKMMKDNEWECRWREIMIENNRCRYMMIDDDRGSRSWKMMKDDKRWWKMMKDDYDRWW